MALPRRGYDAFSPPDAGAAKAAGYEFGMHYGAGGTKNKWLTHAVRTANHNAGIDVGLNYEGDESDADSGFAGGVKNATKANDFFDSLDAPTDVAIYYSVDTARTADQIREYFRGIASVGRRPVGGYGGTEMLAMLDEGLIRYWWQANAGGWSGFQTQHFPSHPRACIRQFVDVTNPIPIPHAQVGEQQFANIKQDEQLMDDCGLWLSPTSTQGDMLSAADIQAIEAHIDATVRDAERTINKAQDDHSGEIIAAIREQSAILSRIAAKLGA